jgi:hypothetical protein
MNMNDIITFEWKATLECIDVGNLVDVVQNMSWTCIATLEDTSCFTLGSSELGNAVDDEHYIAVGDITSDTIRGWVEGAADIENALTDRVTIMHYMPERRSIEAPVGE